MPNVSLQQGAVVEWGVASRALPGEDISGDFYIVQPFTRGVLLGAVDGLGHGEEATLAARSAVETLGKHATESVISLTRRCHERLLTTRGVAMTLVTFNALERTLTALGVGDVETVLVRADGNVSPRRESILLRSGVVGYQLPALTGSVFPVYRDDILVFCTDGIDPAFVDDLAVRDTPQETADLIMDRYFKGNDDALVLAVRFP